MPNTQNTSVIDALTENSLKTRFEDIDQATIDNTRRRILDMIGCGIGGARGTGNPELAEVVNNWGGKKEATILGYGYKAPVHNVAMVNCVFGRTYDRGPLTNIIDGKRFPNHTTKPLFCCPRPGRGRGISGRT
jgi:hypothetical protein